MIHDSVAEAIKQVLQVEEVAFNLPPKREFGDFSTAVCMAQAKVRRMAPVKIAEEAAQQLRELNLPHIAQIEVTAPGYLNFKINYQTYAAQTLESVRSLGRLYGTQQSKNTDKILIEHTNVNPNKAMHIGHLRNAIIGDSIVRILRKLGHSVEACNYIDDTGVQVADVVVAMLYMDEPKYDGDESRIDEIWGKYDGSVPFDYWCWDIYARVARSYEGDSALREKRAEVLHAVEAQEGPIAKFAKELATKIVKAHLATVARLNVFYDLLNWESDIFDRGFWKTAFELLKDSGAMVYETEGLNAGCWVVKFGQGVFETSEGIKSEDKVLVRSNGTVTYTGKDIAYQMWKFGILGKDFLYSEWGEQANGEILWTTCPNGEPDERFGHAQKVINVIDVRQSYTQNIVYDCLDRLGYPEQAKNSIHLDYEVVVLSSTAAKELGIEQDSEDGSAQAMSGRKGLGVKGDDLLDIMAEKLAEKVSDPANVPLLATAAIRYFMSKVTTGKMIVFDFEEALRTTGDTGIYCEYAHARACSILEKSGVESFDNVKVPTKLTQPEEDLLRKIDEFSGALKEAAAQLSPAPLAHYVFELATLFTDYYETPDPGAEYQVPFIKIEEPELKLFRLSLVDTFRQTIANCFDALGITPLQKI